MTARLLVRLDLLPERSAAQERRPRLAPPLLHRDPRARPPARVGAVGTVRELAPGSSARVQLRLADRLAAAPGDRFIVRRLSPVQTIGGGVVLDPLPAAPRGRLSDGEIAALDRLESGTLAERLELWIAAARERGAGEEALAQRGGVSASGRPRRARVLARGGPRPRAAALARPLPRGARARGARGPGRRAAAEAARGRCGGGRRAAKHAPAAAASGRGSAVGRGGRDGARRARRARDRRRGGAGPGARGPRDAGARALRAHRRRSSASGASSPPAPSEVATALRRHPKIVEGLIGYLVKKGDLVKLPGGWIVARDAVDDVVARLRGRAGSSLDVGEFKTLFGLTRKLAIPLLEHLDAAKVTRRVGDRREIVRARRGGARLLPVLRSERPAQGDDLLDVDRVGDLPAQAELVPALGGRAVGLRGAQDPSRSWILRKYGIRTGSLASSAIARSTWPDLVDVNPELHREGSLVRVGGPRASSAESARCRPGRWAPFHREAGAGLRDSSQSASVPHASGVGIAVEGVTGVRTAEGSWASGPRRRGRSCRRPTCPPPGRRGEPA